MEAEGTDGGSDGFDGGTGGSVIRGSGKAKPISQSHNPGLLFGSGTSGSLTRKESYHS